MTIKPNRDDTKALGDALLRRNGYGTDPEPKSRLHRAGNFYLDHCTAIHLGAATVLILICIVMGNIR